MKKEYSFVFSLQYNKDAGKKGENKWIIHGLWPNGVDHPPEQEGWDIHKLAYETILELEIYWPSYRGADYKFWRHEYNKHGKDMPFVETEDDFFKFVLHLYKKYEPSAENISPRVDKETGEAMQEYRFHLNEKFEIITEGLHPS